MRFAVVVVCLAALPVTVSAQSVSRFKSASLTAAAKTGAQATTPATVKDLPVRKVVLYKNGVGYFEHAGMVDGNQRVAIDFTSSQLNDVLQSLTVLDQGGGRIADVDYNSTTPLEQQLKTLSIGLGAQTTFAKFFNAMRGARVEVRSAGGTFAGRIMDIEEHKTGTGKDNDGMVEERFLTVVSDTGDVRVFPVTPALDVRLVDAGLDGDVNRYLELLNTARSTGLRQLTLDAIGTGRREIQVSYISEVPVWKSTYRIVFPQAANGNATVQGWAVVDNTVGADWDNVQLSLVAGAPQSFIQPLSRPIYVQRPEVPIATAAQTRPETHEAAETVTVQSEMANNALIAPPPMPPPTGFGVATMQGLRGGVAHGSGNGYGPGYGGGAGGGIYRVTDALQQGDVSSNAFDDFFEYAIAQPVTIHKNESAMVPILQQDLPAEHVTLWSDRDRTPLRAVWLDNTSKLTLDGGSFSIFENGEFAGEGLLNAIHPGEKRLLSYAVDQAVKVHRGDFADKRMLHSVAVHQGVMVETTSEVNSSTYTVANTADDARTVIVEHTRQQNATLESETKPAETTADAYRFRVAVDPHQTVELKVAERAMLSQTIQIGPLYNSNILVTTSKYSPALAEKLKPLIDAEHALFQAMGKIVENQQKLDALAKDEQRDRDNVKALKGNDAAKRFVDELNSDEDQLEAARKLEADLEQQRDAARAHVNALIAQLSFDTDVDAAL